MLDKNEGKEEVVEGEATKTEAEAGKEKPASSAETKNTDTGGKTEPEKTVPYERFAEVNEERKQAMQQLAGMNEQLAELTWQIEELQTKPEISDEPKTIEEQVQTLQKKVVELNEKILQSEEKSVVAQEQTRILGECKDLKEKFPLMNRDEVLLKHLNSEGKLSLASLAEKSHKDKLAEKQAYIDEYVKTKAKDATHIARTSTAGVPSAKDTEAPEKDRKTVKDHFNWATKKATEFLTRAKSE